MKVVFRTDASLDIGTGHVMRCLTLADVLKSGGARCHFICREHPGNLIEQIRQRGYPVVGLAKGAAVCAPGSFSEANRRGYETWLGADWATDAAQTKVGVGDTMVDWIIADHYAIDARWEKTLRLMCRKLMVIDDLADRSHDCDLLLDQNLGRDVRDYSERVPMKCTVLAGPNYALLRPEFPAQREYSLRRRAIPKLKHLLIAMGGVDQVDATSQVLEAMKNCALPEDTRITIVMGPHAPWLKRVQFLAEQLPHSIEVKVNVQNMAQLMADSDLAIGAAGSTSWERCCLGLPSIIGVLATNQKSIANSLHLAGAAKIFCIDAGVETLRELIDHVFGDSINLAEMIASAANVTDGCGTGRVVSKLQVLRQI